MPVVIFERELSSDLFILDMIDYDVILGMYFLSKYEATIDCKAKVVSFKPSGEGMFVFFGDRCGSPKIFILAMKMRKWLASVCTGYFTSVVDTAKKEKDELHDVPVVIEFASVLLEDLPFYLPIERWHSRLKIYQGQRRFQKHHIEWHPQN